jgi:anti-anti-sigma factor
MNMQEELVEGVLVLRPDGRLDGTTAPVFSEQLLRYFSEHDAAVIDFSAVVYVSSAGLRAILMATKHRRQSGGLMALCALSDPVREVFEISGFLSIIDVTPDIGSALDKLLR